MVISVNDTVVVLDTGTGASGKAIVTIVTPGGPAAGDITVQAWDGNQFTAANNFNSGSLKVFVYGSAYSKGRSTLTGALQQVLVLKDYLLILLLHNFLTHQLLLETNI